MRRLLAVLAILVASATSIPPSHAARTGPLDACAREWTRTGYYRDIPCSEVNRAINEAAAWWGIDEQRFRRVIRCESSFNPFANRYGLVQTHRRVLAPGGAPLQRRRRPHRHRPG